MSDKPDLSEEDLFGDLDLGPSNNHPAAPPPVLTEIESGKKQIIAPLPSEVVAAKRSVTTTQALKQPPGRGLMGLWIALAIVLVVGGGGVGALFFLEIGPFAPQARVQPPIRPLIRKRTKNTRFVILETKPKGASIKINGKDVPFMTPYKLRMVIGRKYKFVFKLKDHDEQTREIKLTQKGKPIKVEATLVPIDPRRSKKITGEPGVIWIECFPLGATIYVGLDKRGVCKNGTVRVEVNPGTHPIRIELKGYETLKENVTVGAGEGEPRKYVLSKAVPGKRKKAPKVRRPRTRKGKIRRKRRLRGSGTAVIACSPSASVFWKGDKIGTTPLTHKFPAGRHRLVLKNGKLGALRVVTISVKPKAKSSNKFTFRKGRIRFKIKPWGDVFVNGKKIGQTPIPPYSIFEGFHTIEVRNKKKTHRQRVQVRGGRTSYVIHAF